MRKLNLISLEEAVHQLTDRRARLWGLRERGRIEEGFVRGGEGEATLRGDIASDVDPNATRVEFKTPDRPAIRETSTERIVSTHD